jgi:thiol-disulfide isomerase/thioredoxin
MAEVYNRAVAPLDPGTPFPSIMLRDDNGRAAAVPRGDTLYGFFKTTCPACALAWPYLDRVQRLGEGGGLSILAVSQDDPETTARFYAGLGVAIPTLYDPDPWPASEALGLTAVPTFLLVGEDRVVLDRAEGFQRSKMEQFAEQAARLAGRPAEALFSPDENVPAIKPG